MALSTRPLSPHLQVYRLPLTALLSITHRMTGVVLSFALILITALLLLLAQGEPCYGQLLAYRDHILAQAVYGLLVYALCFHLCHGVRHLFWDAGSALDKATMNLHAGVELFASVLLWALAYFVI